MTPIRIFFNLLQGFFSGIESQSKRLTGLLVFFWKSAFALQLLLPIGCNSFPLPEPKSMLGYFSVDEIPLRTGEDWNRIRHLELHDSGFSDSDIERLPPMERLEFLSLGGTSVESLRHFDNTKYPKLATIYLENTKVDDRSIHEWENPPVITKLFLNGTQISNLEWAVKFPKLRHLNIQRTKVASLNGLENCSNLTNLWIGWTNVKDLTPIFNKKELRYLSVDNLWIRSSHMREFRNSNPYTKIVQFIHLHL